MQIHVLNSIKININCHYVAIYYAISYFLQLSTLQSTAELHVNNASLLVLRYDSFTNTEALMTPSGLPMINVSYDGAGQPTYYQPIHPHQPASVIYNHWGHVVKRQRGNIVERYEYDNLMRQSAIEYGDNTTIEFKFKDRSTKVRDHDHIFINIFSYCIEKTVGAILIKFRIINMK